MPPLVHGDIVYIGPAGSEWASKGWVGAFRISDGKQVWGFIIVPEDCCSTMNADWHRASVQYAMQNVAAVTKASEVIAALG